MPLTPYYDPILGLLRNNDLGTITALDYLGTWNAATNTPTLADGTGTSGQFYIVSVAGTQDLGAGSIVFNIGDWVIYNGSVWQKVDNSDAQEVTITQASHGFVTGDVLYLNSTTYTKAIATSAAAAEVCGIVLASTGTNTFIMLLQGFISGLSGLTAGTVYFLSDSSAGALTATEPTTIGYVSKPLLIAASATTGYFFNMRGQLVSGSGVIITDWASDLTWTINGCGTVSALSVFYRRVNDTMEVRGKFKCGTVAAATVSITLPSGYTMDMSKFTAAANNKVGDAIRIITAAGPTGIATGGYYNACFIDGSDTDDVFIALQVGGDVFTKILGNSLFANSDVCAFQFSIPISGW